MVQTGGRAKVVLLRDAVEAYYGQVYVSDGWRVLNGAEGFVALVRPEDWKQ